MFHPYFFQTKIEVKKYLFTHTINCFSLSIFQSTALKERKSIAMGIAHWKMAGKQFKR